MARRKEKMITLVGACVSVLMCDISVAQQAAVGLGSFVRLGASARAISLGRAYTALAGDDALGAFWNPAAVAYASKAPRVAASNRFFGSQDYGMDGTLSFATLGGTVPVWNRIVVGIGLMRLGVQGIEQYNNRAIYVGEFSDEEMLAIFSIGRRDGPMAIGVSAKFLRQGFSGLTDVGATTGSGFGADVGFIAHLWKPLRIGVTLRDEIDIGSDRSPMTALLGVSFERPVYIGVPARAVAAVDVEQIKDRPVRLHFGVGVEEMPGVAGVLVALRMGHSNRMLESRLSKLLTSNFKGLVESEDLSGDSAQWAFGLGLKRGSVQIDYTFSRGLMHDPQYITFGCQL